MSFKDLKRGDKVEINFEVCAENGFNNFSTFDLSQGVVVSEKIEIKFHGHKNEAAVHLRTIADNKDICISEKTGILYSFIEEEIIL